METETIYQNAIEAVSNGARFKVDFKTSSLKINGKYLIENGKYAGDLGVSLCDMEMLLDNIESLYSEYKHSLPSERSESKRQKYFYALPEDKLGFESIICGENREVAQIKLELYILCQTLNGFQWDAEKMGTWFWQSKQDRDLVVLREWMANNNNQNQQLTF